MVQVNALDLAAFRFDFGLTWAVLFMNADRTVYGRYGSRTNAEGASDVTLRGFRQAALAALEIHRGYPANRDSLAGKAGPAPRFPTPRGYPSLKDFPATVDPAAGERHNPTCIHCHQIDAAEYRWIREAKQPVPDRLLWAYPTPRALGLELDPEERARIRSVVPGSPAEKAGFREKDDLVLLGGQPLVSIADVQWVLEHATEGAVLKAEVRRGAGSASLSLALPPGWRRKGDFSWRSTMGEEIGPEVAGEGLAPAERRALGLSEEAIALRIRRAGSAFAGDALRKDDVLVEVDGLRSGLATFSEFLAHLAQKKERGDRVAVTVLREGKEVRGWIVAR